MFFNHIKDKGTNILIGLLITLSILAVQYLGEHSDLLVRINGIIYDTRLNTMLEPRQTEPEIIILDLDERSMQAEGRWPWPRFKIARMVEKLAEGGAIVVAMDIMYSEPELNPIDKVVSFLEKDQSDLSVIDAVAKHHSDANADLRLSEAIQTTDTVLSMLFNEDAAIRAGTLPRNTIKFYPEEQPDQIKAKLNTAEHWTKYATPLNEQQLATIATPKYQGYVNNINILQEVAPGVGFMNATTDSDGFIRSTRLVSNYNNQFYPSLSLEAVRLFSLVDDIQVLTAENNDEFVITAVMLNDKKIPTDATGRVLIPFKGPARSYKYISATDLLNDRLPEDAFDSAIVFVGTSAVGNADLRSTPVGVQYPGVEVHANIADVLLNTQYLPSSPDWMQGGILVLLVLIGFILSLILPALGPLLIAAFGVVIIIALVFFDFYMWSVNKISFSMATPLLLAFSLTIVNIAVGFFTESNKRKQIKGMMDQYVPPAHVDKILKDPSLLNTAGERKEMSVLFSDIRSFTSISEKLTAMELADLLKRYFSPICESIFQHSGTIDKFVGDMVMAFWNAPLNDENHAENSIICAFDMLKITDKLTEEFVKEGWPEIKIGVGINTGEMNVGDMGSEHRRNYTVLGDSVNLGSRLEGLTKYYGVQLLVSEFTLEKCPNLTFRPIDKVKVKGKDEAVAIFEPLDPAIADKPEVLQELEEYLVAYRSYLAQQWSEAIEKFSALVGKNPDRKVYSIYLEHIDILKDNPPGADWDGSFTHTSK